MAELPRTATPLKMPLVARQLAQSYARLFGSVPDRNVLAAAAAIVALENARGSAIIQHNYGNISWWGQTPDWWAHPKPQQGQPAKFAAYPSHDVGARAWWKLMAKRFRGVLRAGLDANPRKVVRELYRLGYVAPQSPGEEKRYARAVVQFFDDARREWIPRARIYPDAIGAASLVGGAATLTLWTVYQWAQQRSHA